MTDFRIERIWKKEQIEDIGDVRYLKLDQTSAQSVINDKPTFSEGIRIGNSSTYFNLNGNNLELYLNGILIQVWTAAAATSALLLESGDKLLLETGDALLLEA